jgi:hypothetical protein
MTSKARQDHIQDQTVTDPAGPLGLCRLSLEKLPLAPFPTVC